MGGWPKAPPAVGVPLAEQARALFSVAALRDSARTIGAQFAFICRNTHDTRFQSALGLPTIVAHDGYSVLFRQRLEDNARRYLALLPRAHDFERPRSRAVVALQNMIALCREKDIDLEFVIYPYHAQILLLFDSVGLWEAFQGWKRTMVAEIAAHPSTVTGSRMLLWDFSGFHRYATEPIPRPQDRSTQLQYYWEAGHFKKALGDLVLNRVLGQETSPDAAFGVVLTPQNVEAVLAQGRTRRLRNTAPGSQQCCGKSRTSSARSAGPSRERRRRRAVGMPRQP